MSKDCKHYDEELDCCKLLSDWSDAMPVLQPCIDGPCTEYEMAADDKQIDEILQILFMHTSVNSTDDDVRRCARHLYRAGYRKQSEGEWEKRTFIIFDSEKVGFRCSECNTTWDAPTKFCPNCGAKMKGGAE